MKTYTIIIIEAMKRTLVSAAQRVALEHPELGVPKLLLITANPGKYVPYQADGVDIRATDYTQASLQNIVADIKTPIRGVVCRGDMYVQYLRKLVPLLPAAVPVSTPETLEAATSKRLMRQAFAKHFPEITPQFVQVASTDTPAELDKKLASFQFPVIIKPSSLASSVLIQKCDSMAELGRSLQGSFSVVADIYAKERRTEAPELIVEEYLEGDLYSVDSYVTQPGTYWHCPLVSYVSANQLGIDDFFLYKRTAPVDLSEQEIADAQAVAEKAMSAIKLRYSSAHIELVKTKQGWKVIEIGPRLGRFRNIMYKQAYDIDHGYNDVLVRLGLPPLLPSGGIARYCAAYSIYPTQEGFLREITALGEARGRQSTVYFSDTHQVGEYVRYAKNGGHALCEVIFAADTKAQLAKDTAWFEKHVQAVTEQPAERVALGGFEQVALPDFGIENVTAKVDSGAFSGALHATNVRIKIEGGQEVLYFTPLGKKRYATSTTAFEQRVVRSASGHEQLRYIIKTRISIKGNKYDTMIGLSNRRLMKFELLIGRRFLIEHAMVVDAALTKDIDPEYERSQE